MCGIAGYYNFSGCIDRTKFEEMVDMISHRGPDDRGIYYENGLALGHRRLSIIDLSKDGKQPFFYMDRYILVYNGEIYNYKEIRAFLETKGYQFMTRTDTEVLIAAYDYYGRDCVHQFNGMWAFAIYDKKKQELYCSRDRFGVKPFYYYLDNEQLIFASEIKQIILMRDKKPAANRKRLLEFLICGDQDYSEETMFADIMQLKGGCELSLSLETKEYRIKRYYDLSKTKLENKTYKEACTIFLNNFEQSVMLRLRADVPVGYCLSGGLDSSAIVSMANKQIREQQHEQSQHAVSSCFEDKDYDEQEYIDEVIRNSNIHSHKIFPEGSALFEDVDKIIWHMDEPFGSTSIYAQWNVFKEAAGNGLKVMLDGQGADEQLAGYSDFYGVYFAYLLKKFRWITLGKEIKSYLQLRASTERHINAQKIIFSALVSAYGPEKIRRKAVASYFSSLDLPFERECIKKVYDNRNIYPTGDFRQYVLDSIQCGMQSLLHFEDRDSMAFSIESRVPFLDYKLVESIFQMPFEYKIRGGITKAVLRDGLRGILPEKIRLRYSKLGFVTPEDKWINENYDIYKKELEEACDVLSPLIDKDRVMEWFERNKGKVPRGNFITWRIICAGRWTRVFDVSI